MNRNDLMDAFSGLDPKYIEEAAFELHGKPVRKQDAKVIRFRKGLLIALPAVAAAFVLLAVAIIMPTLSRLGKSESASYDSAAEAPAMSEAAEAPSDAMSEAAEAPSDAEAEEAAVVGEATGAVAEEPAYEAEENTKVSEPTEAAAEESFADAWTLGMKKATYEAGILTVE